MSTENPAPHQDDESLRGAAHELAENLNEDPLSALDRADADLRSGRVDQAIRGAAEAAMFGEDRDRVNALLLWGDALAASGDDAAAIAAYRRALIFEAGCPEALFGIALLMNSDDEEGAVALAEMALEFSCDPAGGICPIGRELVSFLDSFGRRASVIRILQDAGWSSELTTSLLNSI